MCGRFSMSARGPGGPNNGEMEMYMSHVTKGSGGNVRCPVLRNYTCPM